MISVGRWATAGLVILFGLLGARDVYAWGDTGHQIICEIAFQELNPQARTQVKQLLQHDPDFTLFSKACTWPDHPRKRASEHFSTCCALMHSSGTIRAPWTSNAW